jgi:alkaline phosphatase D
MATFSRRGLLQGSLAASALTLAATTPAAAVPVTRTSSPALVRRRLHLPSGIATGDVTSSSAILWSRTDSTGRMRARLRAVDAEGTPLRGHGALDRTLTSGWVTDATDHTVKIGATDLPPGTRFALEVRFEDEEGVLSDVAHGTFRTAPGGSRGRGRGRGGARGQSFVWTGDTAGQGWGINPDLGGMYAYRTMHDLAPDFFIHSGDTIYADGPIQAEVVEPDGSVWRNVVVEGVTKVAETQEEYRARHRYNLMDHNVRAMYADVPVVAQWDDHETTNNWWAGEVLEDPRYTVRDVNTLAARGRRAWQEYQPVGDARALRPGTTGFEDQRIHRRLERGPQLDVFCLDMRTFKGENTAGREREATPLLGEEQVQWLIDGVTSSEAVWKVIAADLPLGVIVPDGKAQESVANADDGEPLGRELELARVLRAFKDAGVRNVVWVTADVHYCAAHHYSPERAAFTGFDEFWEFVAGPINAGGFGPNALDGTFGPEQVFAKAGPAGGSPRDGRYQFFGHAQLDEDDVLTVSLRDGYGDTVFSKELVPQR